MLYSNDEIDTALQEGSVWLDNHRIMSEDDLSTNNFVRLPLFYSIYNFFNDATYLFRNEHHASMGMFYRCVYDAATQLWWISLNPNSTSDHQIFLEHLEQDIRHNESILTAIEKSPKSRYYKTIDKIKAAIKTSKETLALGINSFQSKDKSIYRNIANKLKKIKDLDSELTDDIYVDLTRLFHNTSDGIHSRLIININSLLQNPVVPSEDLYQMTTFFYFKSLEIVKVIN